MGVQFFLRQLYKLDKAAVEAELKHLGIHTFKRLTPTETVALTVGSGISADARIFIGRFLRSHNSNRPVFACEKKCKKLCVKHVVAPVYDVFTYEEPKSKTCQQLVRRKVDYWKKDAWEVLMAELRNVRDCKSNNSEVGVVQGELGKVIPVVVQGDSGGGEMKIYAHMSRTTQLSAAEISEFELLCKNFGLKWRKYFEPCNFPPKLHLLETHAPKQMRRFGCLGDKMEAAVERLHHSVNKAKQVFAAIPSYKGKHDAIMQRRDQAELEEVQQTIAKATNMTKRVFSPPVKARKAQENITLKETKRIKRQEAVDSVHTFRIAFNLD